MWSSLAIELAGVVFVGVDIFRTKTNLQSSEPTHGLGAAVVAKGFVGSWFVKHHMGDGSLVIVGSVLALDVLVT